MMKLRELRTLIQAHLLLNEGSVIDIANRSISNIGIIINDANVSSVEVIAISTREVATFKYDDELIEHPKILGSAELEGFGGGYWQLKTLYADNPIAMISILAATLEHLKKVVPDFHLTPASNAVIKRYYDANKDDPTKVEDDVITPQIARAASGADVEYDYQRAAYLGPVGFNLQAARLNAEKAIEKCVTKRYNYASSYATDKVRSMLSRLAAEQFQVAYADIEKTKTGTYKGLLANKDVQELLSWLYKSLTISDKNLRGKAVKFVVDNRNKIDELVKAYDDVHVGYEWDSINRIVKRELRKMDEQE